MNPVGACWWAARASSLSFSACCRASRTPCNSLLAASARAFWALVSCFASLRCLHRDAQCYFSSVTSSRNPSRFAKRGWWPKWHPHGLCPRESLPPVGILKPLGKSTAAGGGHPSPGASDCGPGTRHVTCYLGLKLGYGPSLQPGWHVSATHPSRGLRGASFSCLPPGWTMRRVGGGNASCR